MKLTDEILKKAKNCQSAEEIEALAKENGVELHQGEAAQIFRALNANGELSDSELNAVAGGASYSTAHCSDSAPRYAVGRRCRYYRDTSAKKMYYGYITKVSESKQGSIWKEFVYTIKSDDGQTDEIYESSLDTANQSFFD